MSYGKDDSENINNDRPVVKDKTLSVKAAPLFFTRRFDTIKGITKEQFRKLRAGEIVSIEQKVFDKDLYIKDK